MPRNKALCTSILNGLVERAWESADEGLGMALPLTHKRLWACLFHFFFLGTSFLLGKMESLEPTTRPPRWFPLLPLCGYFCVHSNSPGSSRKGWILLGSLCVWSQGIVWDLRGHICFHRLAYSTLSPPTNPGSAQKYPEGFHKDIFTNSFQKEVKWQNKPCKRNSVYQTI